MEGPWWPGNQETKERGAHPHLFWGILLIIVTGFASDMGDLGSPCWRPWSDIRGVPQPQPGAWSAAARRRGRAGGVEGGLGALLPMVKRAGASGVRRPGRVVAAVLPLGPPL